MQLLGSLSHSGVLIISAPVDPLLIRTSQLQSPAGRGRKVGSSGRSAAAGGSQLMLGDVMLNTGYLWSEVLATLGVNAIGTAHRYHNLEISTAASASTTAFPHHHHLHHHHHAHPQPPPAPHLYHHPHPRHNNHHRHHQHRHQHTHGHGHHRRHRRRCRRFRRRPGIILYRQLDMLSLRTRNFSGFES